MEKPLPTFDAHNVGVKISSSEGGAREVKIRDRVSDTGGKFQKDRENLIGK